MEHKRIVSVIIVILALSCAIVAVSVAVVKDKMEYIPDRAIDDIVSILDDSNIYIDRDIIPAKNERGVVYVCNSGDYSSTVAELISRDKVKYSFVIPDGEILITQNGERFEFGGGFSFRYSRDGKADTGPNQFEFSDMAAHPSDKKTEEIEKLAIEFLDRGSNEFESESAMSIITSVERVWESAGIYYALCRRSIDGVAINDNVVMCAISGSEVVEAYGTWCFLTLGESYYAQLSDILNILFNVKKELEGNKEEVVIEAIQRCYSLYVYGENEDFCLIPCLKIVTDVSGELIYNAIDSTLYTKY